MFKKNLAIIIILGMALFLCSCAAATARKHLNNAKELEQKGLRLQANTEYIRALRGIGNRKTRGEVAQTIAENYLRAGRVEDAISYYRTSIDNFNRAGAQPPYVRLAEVYLMEGDKNIGAASALLRDIDRVEPPHGIEMQVRISRLLGDYMMDKGNWGQAKHFYEQEFSKYAEKSGNEAYIEEAKQKLMNIEIQQKQAPIRID